MLCFSTCPKLFYIIFIKRTVRLKVTHSIIREVTGGLVKGTSKVMGSQTALHSETSFLHCGQVRKGTCTLGVPRCLVWGEGQ